MKKHINKYSVKYLLAAVFALAATGAGAQMKTSYFMEGSIPRYDMNAALTPMHGYINMPLLPIGALGVNLNNNFLSLDNFIYPHGGKHVLFLHESVDPKKFMNRMPHRASLNVDVNYNLLGFGKYSKKHNYFWSFGWNIRAIVDMGIPKEVFGLLKDLKNGSYDIPDVTLGATAYSEFAFGFAMPVGWKDLVVGGRLKFLVGAAQVEAALDNISLEATNTEVKAQLAGTLRASVFGMDYSNMSAGEDGSMEMGDLFDFSNFSIGNGFKSYGAAIDLGAEMKLLDRRLKLSFAINDLGFIQWSGANAVQADMEEVSVEFTGYDINAEKWGVENSGKFGRFTRTGGDSYSKRLSTTMNIGAEYNFFDNLLGVGLLSHTKFSNRITYSELTLAGTVRPADWFTASISHSLVQNKIGIFGFALNFHPRGVNFFLGLDYIPTQMAKINPDVLPLTMWPVRAKSMNFYFGLAFNPGGRSKPWGQSDKAIAVE